MEKSASSPKVHLLVTDLMMPQMNGFELRLFYQGVLVDMVA
jgi:CheY-like chemotaxis protein